MLCRHPDRKLPTQIRHNVIELIHLSSTLEHNKQQSTLKCKRRRMQNYKSRIPRHANCCKAHSIFQSMSTCVWPHNTVLCSPSVHYKQHAECCALSNHTTRWLHNMPSITYLFTVFNHCVWVCRLQPPKQPSSTWMFKVLTEQLKNTCTSDCTNNNPEFVHKLQWTSHVAIASRPSGIVMCRHWRKLQKAVQHKMSGDKTSQKRQ